MRGKLDTCAPPYGKLSTLHLSIGPVGKVKHISAFAAIMPKAEFKDPQTFARAPGIGELAIKKGRHIPSHQITWNLQGGPGRPSSF